MNIKNTTTKQRLTRAALFVLLCAGFGLAFALLLGTSARRVGPVEMRLSLRRAGPH